MGLCYTFNGTDMFVENAGSFVHVSSSRQHLCSHVAYLHNTRANAANSLNRCLRHFCSDVKIRHIVTNC